MTSHGRLRALLVTAVLGPTSTAACVPPYRPPTAAEPHGVVKLRRSYEMNVGKQLAEEIRVNGHEAYSRTRSAQFHAALTDAVLVHPGTASWRFESVFFHTEMRLVREPYQVRTPYTRFQSYSCGSPTFPRTCTRGITDYRYDTHYRSVTRNVNVPDGECTATTAHRVDPDGVYLLQLTYQDDGICALSCYEQTAQGNRRCEYVAVEE